MSEPSEPSEVIGALHEAGKYEDLRSYCSAGLEQNPNDMLYLQNGTSACLHLGLYQEALNYTGRVLKSEPKDVYALRNKAYALENLHRYGEALQCCRTILEYDRQDLWAMNGAGLALAELDRYGEAVEYFERVLKADPHNITALINGALSLERDGRTHQALSYYDMAMHVDPSIRGMGEARARLYRTLNMEDRAYLAEQGIGDKEMDGIISRARDNRCSLFHQLCLEDMGKYEGVDPHADNPFRPQ